MPIEFETFTPWNVAERGPLTLEAIRSIHRPNGDFRISPSLYNGSTQFACASRACYVYVLSGTCHYEMKGRVWKLVGPCYAELPAGQFYFRVDCDSSVELVSVWELPVGFRGRDGSNEPSDRPESPNGPF